MLPPRTSPPPFTLLRCPHGPSFSTVAQTAMYSLVSESASSDSLSTTFPARTSSRPLRRPSRVNHRLTPCPPHCPNIQRGQPASYSQCSGSTCGLPLRLGAGSRCARHRQDQDGCCGSSWQVSNSRHSRTFLRSGTLTCVLTRCVACTDLSSPAARTAQALRRTPPPRAPSATLLTCRRRGEHTYANNYVVYVPRADACSMEAYPHCLHTRATLLRERHPHGPSISAVAQTAMHSLVSSSSEPLSTT